MVKNKQTIQAKSLNNGFDSSEETNKQRTAVRVDTEGSGIYFKVRIKPTYQAVISSSA